MVGSQLAVFLVLIASWHHGSSADRNLGQLTLAVKKAENQRAVESELNTGRAGLTPLPPSGEREREREREKQL